MSDYAKRQGGHVQTPTILMQSRALSPSEKTVYGVIRSHWNTVDGKCYPGQQTIARKAKMSVRNVRTICNKLKQKGVLRWSGGRGRGNVCHYEFPLQDGDMEEKVEIIKALKRGSRVPLLGESQKGEIPDTKRGSAVQRTRTSQNRPQTPVVQGFETSQKGEDSAPLTKNYIKKELKAGASLDNGQGCPLLEERQPGPRLSLHEKAATKLLVGLPRREPQPSEVDRVVRLLERRLSGRQILNILKTKPRTADGTLGR